MLLGTRTSKAQKYESWSQVTYAVTGDKKRASERKSRVLAAHGKMS